MTKLARGNLGRFLAHLRSFISIWRIFFHCFYFISQKCSQYTERFGKTKESRKTEKCHRKTVHCSERLCRGVLGAPWSCLFLQEWTHCILGSPKVELWFFCLGLSPGKQRHISRQMFQMSQLTCCWLLWHFPDGWPDMRTSNMHVKLHILLNDMQPSLELLVVLARSIMSYVSAGGNLWDASSLAVSLVVGYIFSRFFLHNCSYLMVSGVDIVGHILTLCVPKISMLWTNPADSIHSIPHCGRFSNFVLQYFELCHKNVLNIWLFCVVCEIRYLPEDNYILYPNDIIWNPERAFGHFQQMNVRCWRFFWGIHLHNICCSECCFGVYNDKGKTERWRLTHYKCLVVPT